LEKRQLQFIFFEVTWQQATKHINKSISGATLSVYRSECLVVRGEEEQKLSFAVPDSILVGCGTVQLVKGDDPQENNIAYISTIEHWKLNLFAF
jgi:hypothetical protein